MERGHGRAPSADNTKAAADEPAAKIRRESHEVTAATTVEVPGDESLLMAHEGSASTTPSSCQQRGVALILSHRLSKDPQGTNTAARPRLIRGPMTTAPLAGISTLKTVAHIEESVFTVFLFRCANVGHQIQPH